MRELDHDRAGARADRRGAVAGALGRGAAGRARLAPRRARPDDGRRCRREAAAAAPLAETLELSLDNDVVLWSEPPALAAWCADGRRCLLAEDVCRAFGQFADRCGARALNTGIRGLPPGFDYAARLRATLARQPVQLDSELDEQGLQVATLVDDAPYVVPLEDVTICSPFPPHVAHLGRHGAHFVGLNTRRLPFRLYDGRPSELVRAEHFDARLPELLLRLGAAAAAVTPCAGV